MTSPDWNGLGQIATAIGVVVTAIFSYLARRSSNKNAVVLKDQNVVLNEVKENTNGNLLQQTRIAANALEELATVTGHPAHREAADAATALLKQREEVQAKTKL